MTRCCVDVDFAPNDMTCEPDTTGPEAQASALEAFENTKEALEQRAREAVEERKCAGLEGLVGGLQCVIINTETDRQADAVKELLRYTNYTCADAFEDERMRTCVLKTPGSADVLITARLDGPSPFAHLNDAPKARHLPNTRFETLVFETADIDAYVELQQKRGTAFMIDEPVRADGFAFIQTPPSRFTGNSLGLVEWTGRAGQYRTPDSQTLDWTFPKPDAPHLKNIKEIDHIATRVAARDRDPAIVEFIELTNYQFDFAIYVKSLNSITNVARNPGHPFAMVFTSGISPYKDDETSGPTEKFVHNYGPRAHHVAFHTEAIDETFRAVREDGLDFLVELVGSREEGLKQAFSAPSPRTLLVNEYIQRYDGFDGFFTKGNVTRLTEATDRQ